MKATRRILSLLLALTLVLGLALTAIADNDVQVEEYATTDHPQVLGENNKPTTDGRIEVSNAVAGRTYTLLKLFDVTIENGSTRYWLPSDKTDLKVSVGNPAREIDASEWFEVIDGATATDPKEIKIKGDWDATPAQVDAVMKSEDFQEWAKAYGEEIISAMAKAPAAGATAGASSNTENNIIAFTKIPYGYYTLTVGKNDTIDPKDDDTFKGVASINTANPEGKFADKNDGPHWTEEYGKKIKDKEIDGDKEAPNSAYGVGETIPYTVSITTRNIDEDDGGAYIYRYFVYDTVSEYLSYDGVPALKIAGQDISSADRVGYTYFTVPYETVQAKLEELAGSSDPDAVAGVTWAQLEAAEPTWILKADPATGIVDKTKARSFRADIVWMLPEEQFIDERTFVEDTANPGTYKEIFWNETAQTWEDTKTADNASKADGYYDYNVSGKESYGGLAYATKSPTDTSSNAFYTQLYGDGAILELTYNAFLDADKLGDKDPGDIASDNKAGFGIYNSNDDPDSVQPKDPKTIAPEQKAKDYTVELVIYKQDDQGNPLAGAFFKLTGDGTKKTLVETQQFVEDANGTNWKLKSGEYTDESPLELYANLTVPGNEALLKLYAEYDDSKAANAQTPASWKKYSLQWTKSYVDATVAANATPVEANVVTDADKYTIEGAVDTDKMRAEWAGLGSGIYQLVESTTPNGYNPIADKYIRIRFNDPDDTTFQSGDQIFIAEEVVNTAANANADPVWELAPNGMTFTYVEGKATEYDDQGNVTVQGYPCKLLATVVNNKGGELPSTGGIGTTIFYVVGSVLIVGAAVVLYSRKRMSVEDNH